MLIISVCFCGLLLSLCFYYFEYFVVFVCFCLFLAYAILMVVCFYV